MKTKDDKIIIDGKEQNIPTFVFIAKDEMALPVLEYYYDICKDAGCDEDFLNSLSDRIVEFMDWKVKNLDKIHLPN